MKYKIVFSKTLFGRCNVEATSSEEALRIINANKNKYIRFFDSNDFRIEDISEDKDGDN